MNWLDRYVAAVKNYLPAQKREDIGDELAGILEDSLSAHEEERGQALSDNDLKAWVGDLQHPMKMASSYLPQQQLIGETLYPFYLYSLKITLMIIFAVSVVLQALDAVLLSGLPDAFSAVFGSLFASLAGGFTVVTLIFAIVERSPINKQCLQKWKVDNLPDSKAKAPWMDIPWYSSVATMISVLIFVLIINGVSAMDLGFVAGGALASEAFSGILPLINIACLGVIVLNGVHFVQPRWTTLTLIVNLGLHALGGWIWYQVSQWQQSDWIVKLPSEQNNEVVVRLLEHVGQTVGIIAYIAIIIVSYEVLRDIYRIFVLSREESAL